MAGEPGFIPRLRGLRGGIESQLLKGGMTLKTEFTVIGFLHYISIIQPLAWAWPRSSSQNTIVNSTQARSELNGKCVSGGRRNQNGQAGDYVSEKN